MYILNIAVNFILAGRTDLPHPSPLPKGRGDKKIEGFY